MNNSIVIILSIKGHHTGFPLWKKVVAGMMAGGFGQFFASPTDLVKTQIQVF